MMLSIRFWVCCLRVAILRGTCTLRRWLAQKMANWLDRYMDGIADETAGFALCGRDCRTGEPPHSGAIAAARAVGPQPQPKRIGARAWSASVRAACARDGCHIPAARDSFWGQSELVADIIEPA